MASRRAAAACPPWRLPFAAIPMSVTRICCSRAWPCSMSERVENIPCNIGADLVESLPEIVFAQNYTLSELLFISNN